MMNSVRILGEINIAWFLAWQDIKIRYRRSIIGPLWITLSMAVFCISLGYIFGTLFDSELNEYMPFLSAGYIIWTFVAGVIAESPNVYVEAAAYIRDIKFSKLIIIARMVFRHLISLCHNALIIVGVFLFFRISPGVEALVFLPGFMLVLLNVVAISGGLALIGCRFRDISPATQSALQILFFVTPLTWLPKLLPADSLLLKLNPFAYFLDLTRSPLLGDLPRWESWVGAGLCFLLFSSLTVSLYKSKSRDIPYWV